MIEVDPNEIKALNEWNCAMLNKRRNRVLKCRVFTAWKQVAIEDLNTNSKEESSISQRNTSFKSIASNSSQNIAFSRTNRTTEALQAELNSLLNEQAELESATAQIRATLKNLPRSGSTYRSSAYSTTTSSFSTTCRTRYI